MKAESHPDIEERAESDRRTHEFLAMLAHELRNPLASIMNAAHLLKRLEDRDARLELARRVIDRQVRHLAYVLDDLLDVSRLTRGRIQLRVSPIDVSAVVRDAVEDCRAAMAQAELDVSVELPTGPLIVFGDAVRLTQVVLNLLTNAIKFTDRGGQITVRLAVAQDGDASQLELTVRDTGIGMEPEMVSRVFDTFAQADRSLDRSRGGLGLGLALVKGLVELHGGEVQAASEGLGRGAAFTVRLPLWTGEPMDPSALPINTDEPVAPPCVSEDPLGARQNV